LTPPNIATYGYDSSNRRIIKTVGSTITHYIYDAASQLIAETNSSGTPLKEYIYLDGEVIAVKEYQSNPGLYYYLNDHLGTPQRLIAADGTVVWQAAYLPFGAAQVSIAQVVNNIRFPGQYYDSETGLHYNWHRFYDPDTGRYISADPIGLAGGMNLYAYVQGNPVNAVDPEGLLTRYYPAPNRRTPEDIIQDSDDWLKEHPREPEPEPYVYRMGCKQCYFECALKAGLGEDVTQLLEGIGKEGIDAVRKTGRKGITKIIGKRAFTLVSAASTAQSLAGFYDCIEDCNKCCEE